jgi:class 3 adenylate cyclase
MADREYAAGRRAEAAAAAPAGGWAMVSFRTRRRRRADASAYRSPPVIQTACSAVSLGHRRKMLAAERTGAVEASPRPTSTETKPPDAGAERRQVTVMFSDLVGLTALARRMDPEDLREVISDYQKCLAETVSGSALLLTSISTTAAEPASR